MSNTIATNAVDTARADMLREVQLTLDNMGREIRHSANADEHNRWEDPNAPNAPTDEYSWTSDNSTLVLATAALDSERNIIFADPLHYVTTKNNIIYHVQDNTLYKRMLAAPDENNTASTSCPPAPNDGCPDDVALIHNIKNFSVRYFDNQDTEVPPAQAQSVEISLSIEQVKYGQTISADFSTRTVFRNE